jgi:serine/threonine protein kinase/Flp pilus assembly protein TadD
MIGTKLTHYRITAKLGEGGMGEVYRAADSKLGREVAIKVLPANFSRDPQSLARFEREGRALAALNHPHIAAIYGFDADQGTHFLVMELVEGETLNERLQRGPLPVREALAVARQMAEAIQEAHEKGIIHRDLKPGNVKITPNGRVKVLDFGLAKMGFAGSAGKLARISAPFAANDAGVSGTDAPTLKAEATRPGAVMGTPAYMSPEQARGQEVDKGTDIWAFGCCLYECLSGRKPFQGKTASDLMAAVLKSDPDWSQIPAETPREIVTLLRRCLEKDPSRRLRSIRDIAITIEETTKMSVRSSSERWRWPVAAVGPLILIMGAGIFVWKRSASNRIAQAGSEVVKSNAVALASTRSATDLKSIAVLPFVNMSGNVENEYFSDGISEEILNALARTPGLRVAARTSAFFFKGKNEPVQKIGEALKVGVVLEGSVRRAGNQLRITAQLISVADGFHLWSDTFDRQAEDVFAIQSEVAQRVLAALKLKLLDDRGPTAPHGGTDNLEAYDLFLHGRQLWNKRTGADLERAIGYFQQATEKDPKFALAYAGVAACYAVMADHSEVAVKETLPKTRAAARRALELDPRLAEAHTLLARCMHAEGDVAGAEKGFNEALAMSPNYATAHHWYALFLADCGKPERALVEIRQAHALDPLSAVIQAELGTVLLRNRRYDEAVAQEDKALRLSPDFPYAYLLRGLVRAAQRKFPEAIADLKRAQALGNNSRWVSSGLGYSYAASGRTNEAQQQIEDLKANAAKGHSVSTFIALVYQALGDQEQVYAWLERAALDPLERVQLLQHNPLWDDLKTDPRYAALLKRHGLDQ